MIRTPSLPLTIQREGGTVKLEAAIVSFPSSPGSNYVVGEFVPAINSQLGQYTLQKVLAKNVGGNNLILGKHFVNGAVQNFIPFSVGSNIASTKWKATFPITDLNAWRGDYINELNGVGDTMPTISKHTLSLIHI